MRRNPAPLFLALALVVGVMLCNEARADDTYASITLRPGADAGTTAVTTAYPAGGNQGMIRCDSHPVRLKMCDSASTCTATSNDTLIDADKSTDICPPVSRRSLSVYRAYDGGVPDCRLYIVNPKTVCPP